MRQIPEPLYSRVLELSLRIANAGEADDSRAWHGAYRRLRSLYRSRLGKPDPFLTETLADFTSGPRTAAKLYRLAIQQCAEFPDEVLYTKHIGLARALLDIGNASEAASLLHTARLEATAQNDRSAFADIDELTSLPRETS